MGQLLNALPGLPVPPPAELLRAGPRIWIYRLAGAMPRAMLYRWPQGPAARATKPSDRLSGDASVDVSSREEAPGAVKIESMRPGSVELVTTSTVDSLLVLHDLYYPGWTAEIDGKSALILRAALLFRGVLCRPGVIG
jgi:hypothetical protein